MAVSHQWFLQWSAPTPYFSDISSEFKKVSPDWNVPDNNYNRKYIKPYEYPTVNNGLYRSRTHVPNYKETKFERENPYIDGK